jgi:hypothetical protein
LKQKKTLNGEKKRKHLTEKGGSSGEGEALSAQRERERESGAKIYDK